MFHSIVRPKAIVFINLITSAVLNNTASKISSKFGMVNYDNMDPLLPYFKCLSTFPTWFPGTDQNTSGNPQEMEKSWNSLNCLLAGSCKTGYSWAELCAWATNVAVSAWLESAPESLDPSRIASLRHLTLEKQERRLQSDGTQKKIIAITSHNL